MQSLPPLRTSSATLLKRAIPLASLLLFLGLASHQLRLPGLNYDEAFDPVPAMQLLLGQPVETLGGSGLLIGSRTLPLMVMAYKGVVHTYWGLPFLWALGINAFALRLSCLFLSTLALAATYRFTRQTFGVWAAAGTVVLLATNPSFIFWSRQGVLWTSGMLACSVGALSLLSSYLRKKESPALWLAAFLLGLGLSAKLAFFWFPVALALIGIAIAVPRLRRVWQRRAVGETAERQRAWTKALARWAGALAAFLLGLAPVIIYNVQTQGTLDLVRHHLQTSYYGVDNLAWLTNLSIRWQHLQALLGSTSLWYLGTVRGDALFLRAFWLGSAVLVASSTWSILRLLRDRSERPPRHSQIEAPPPSTPLRASLAPLLPLLILGLMFVQSGVTVSSLEPEHYLLLLPFPQLVVALAIDSLRRWIGGRVSYLLAGLALALLIGSQIVVAAQYHDALAATGGLAAHSEASYALADYLAREGRPVVAMDWGIKMQTQFLTSGALPIAECFGYESIEEPGESFQACVDPHLSLPETCYVFHPLSGTVFAGRLEALQAMADERGLSLALLHEITDRRGEVVFLVMEAQAGE
jgi:hypothetical protein